MPKNDFESTNFANFEEVVHNFGWSDDDMIYWTNAYFNYMQRWFDAQLDRKFMNSTYPLPSSEEIIPVHSSKSGVFIDILDIA
jgi:hypothetical protein